MSRQYTVTTRFNRQTTLLLLLLLCPLLASAQYELLWQTPPFGQETGAYKRVISSETDHEGNLLLLAQTYSSSTDSRMVLYKYSGDGSLLWQIVPQQPNPELQESPVKLRVDANGNSYVLTNLTQNFENAGAILSKVSPAGEGMWSRTFTSDSYIFTRSNDLVVNEAQEVFVAGKGMHEGTSIGIVAKLQPNGNTAWSRATSGETVNTITLNQSEDVVAAGTTYAQMQERGNLHLLTMHRDNGELLMDKTYGFRMQTVYSNDMPTHVHVTASGDILVLSEISSPLNTTDFNVVLMRTDSQGAVKWQQMIGNTDESRVLDVAFADSEEVVVLGLEAKYRQTADYFLTKVSVDGQKQWYHTFNRYDGATIHELAPADVDISADGNIALTAHAAVFNVPPAWFVPPVYQQQPVLVSILYNMDGEQVWENVYEPYPESYTYGRSISFDAEGNLFVAASTTPADSQPSYEHIILYKFGAADKATTPLNVQLYLPPYSMRVGEQVRTTADFNDYILTEDTGIRWTWGDGSSPTISYTAFGTDRITGEHRYQEAGIYTIGLNFDESNFSALSDNYKQQMIIYDPMAGAVAGAGQLEHEEVALPYVQGNRETTFAFSVRYPNASSKKPVGATVFLLNNQNRFHSTSYDWLVVNENHAAWKGTGTLDGKSGYSFLATVLDGGGDGINDPEDRMRIQIWDSRNQMVYDTEGTKSPVADLYQTLPHIKIGQIIIYNTTHPLFASLTSGLQLEDELEGVIAYPNPFRDKATVTFAAMQAGSYSAALYDMKGALVKELKQGTVSTGEVVAIEVDGAELPGGIYFTRIATPDEVKTVKLILQR